MSKAKAFGAKGAKKEIEPALPKVSDLSYPDVDVFISTHYESEELLYRSINGCVHMDYPDLSKVHIYLCDAAERLELAILAKTMGVGYISGTINDALSATASPLIATFTADTVPMRGFLTNTVPYFTLGKIGFVQTPQGFYNPDLFQYNLYAENKIPNDQDYFSRVMNVKRNRSNSALFTGTNAVISREALVNAGGFSSIYLLECFQTGLHIQKNGWTTYATGTTLAHGMTQNCFSAMLKQYKRLLRDCMNSIRNEHIITSPSLKPAAKLDYLAIGFYWWRFILRFIFILLPIILVGLNVSMLYTDLGVIFLMCLPAYLLHALCISKSAKGVRNAHVNGVTGTVLAPFLVFPVIWAMIPTKKPTAPVKAKRVFENNIRHAVPHMILLLSSVIAFIFSIKGSLSGFEVTHLVMWVWLLINIKNLSFALFFMLGRKNLRVAQRFHVNLNASIHTGYQKLNATTLDISEEGIALTLPVPSYIPYEKDSELTITYSMYRATVKARVIHVEQRNDGTWKYCFKITNIDEDQKGNYFQIIYDRHHTLPDKITDNWNIFGDVKSNIFSRLNAKITQQRKLPRIPLNIPISLGKDTAYITSFNYRYFTINTNGCYSFILLNGIKFRQSSLTFKLRVEPNIHNAKELLFEISNIDELLQSDEMLLIANKFMNSDQPMTAILTGFMAEASSAAKAYPRSALAAV